MKANIAIFVPHVGCPHRCSFCDQRAITGTERLPRGADVTETASRVVRQMGSKAKKAEIAFFGGSFTAIDRQYMIELLAAAAPFVREGKTGGIRISTRPDAIDRKVLGILKKYGVTAIELGAQSMDDQVLLKNERGHTAAQVEAASAQIKDEGFELGLQMMTGLFGSRPELDVQTAEKLAALCPDTVRIYPAVTLKNTLLERLCREGRYLPPTLDETVQLCARLLRFFHGKGIPVIKLGLHASQEVEKNFVAGPYHPAFRELCESKIYLENAQAALGKESGEFILYVNPSCISKMAGQKKQNLKALAQQGKICRIRGRESLTIYEVETEKERTACF